MARARDWDLYRRRNNRREDTPMHTIAAGGCWCGQDYGHDWPGKEDGAPHPKPGENQTPGPVGCQPADCCGEPEKHLKAEETHTGDDVTGTFGYEHKGRREDCTVCPARCEYTVVARGYKAPVFTCSNEEPHNAPQECLLSYVGRVD